jgi:ATP-dependent RNA helicase DDX52/ROK1
VSAKVSATKSCEHVTWNLQPFAVQSLLPVQMEAFKLLSRGGARFDKKRFQSDVKVFDVRTPVRCVYIPCQPSPQKSQTKETKPRTSEELPPELDFFKYAQTKETKRKSVELDRNDDVDVQRKTKKQRSDRVEGTIDEDEEPSGTQRHRVATKGSNIPACIHSFEELRERFHLSSLLLTNLPNCGYKRPTAVQSYGIPILLEVRSTLNKTVTQY